MSYGFSLVIMAACVVFFYRAGEMEYSSGFLPAILSLALWLGGAYLLHWGLFGCILLQVGLFGALTAYNMVRKRPGH
jgi:hypothetical protein